MFRKFKLSRGSMPTHPLLYYAPKGNSTLPKWRVVQGTSQLNWDTGKYREGIYQPRPQGFSLKEKPWGRGWVFILAEIRIQIVDNSWSFTRKEFGLYCFEEPSHFWN